eukprot:CAMPEP_0119397884 /NCGR_PEP_ID=MMETSP1334-20130426/140561_1 /TAXON_ID=127549 /ORGANISM="Calcidiscus leptoporus, Strain RCC1130" /LENGTH=318 /DNA_ID=CAMNT_0007421735 /DNA_START=1012 /DNA_END=1969 /DNA_ORIENTATION=-
MACSLHVLDRGSRAVLVTPSPTDHSQIKVGLYSSPACISPPPPPPPSPPLDLKKRTLTASHDDVVQALLASSASRERRGAPARADLHRACRTLTNAAAASLSAAAVAALLCAAVYFAAAFHSAQGHAPAALQPVRGEPVLLRTLPPRPRRAMQSRAHLGGEHSPEQGRPVRQARVPLGIHPRVRKRRRQSREPDPRDAAESWAQGGPLQLARVHLASAAASAVAASAAAAQLEKRHRSSTSTYDRAVSLGIADRLLEIPPSLHGLIESGGPEKENAKRALHKLHQANQQLIARAENSRRLKEQRTKIPTARRSRSNRS